LNWRFEEKKQIGLTNAINLSLNRDLVDSLKYTNKELAFKNLDEISSTFKEYTPYKNIKIHIHTAQTKSYLRNWNKDKYGDDLSAFRDSLVYMKEVQKPFATVESGRAGMLLRGISPIFENSDYIGSVEFIQGFNSIATKVKEQKKFDTVFLACRDDKNIQRFQTDIRKVSGLYVSKQEYINESLLTTLKDFEPDYISEYGYMIKNNLFITAVPLKNHQDKRVGCAIISSDIAYVTSFVEETKSSMLNQLYLIILIDILLLLSLMYILNISLKKPIYKLIKSIKKIEENLNSDNLKELYKEHKINISSNDEIGEMSKSINKLLKTTAKVFVDYKESDKYAQEYIKAVNAGSIVSKSDTRGIITYVNEELCKRTGYEKEELIGKPHSIFRHPNTPKQTFRKLWETIQKGEIYHGLFKNKKKNGTTFYANITIVPIKDKDDNIIEYIALRDDVTELVNSKKELKRNFLTDPLTSLGNRFKLIEDIDRKNKTYLAIIDIHYFKEINDFYGHKMGDLVIVDLSNRLFEHFRVAGYELYHLHGDEFAVLVEKKHSSKDEFLKLVKEFLEKNKGNNLTIEGNQIVVRLTCGISYNDKNLIIEADMAHKKAKKTNKEILEYTNDINSEEEYKKNLEWTNEIKNAIADNRIKAFFQPIINSQTNKIEKYETLMRLIKEDGTEVSPFFFLDIAKKTRYYKDLTKIVVLQAFEKFKGTSYEFSVNLSAEDIMIHDVSDWFFELACEYKVNEQVVIELVESEGIESFDTMDTFIQNAKDNGMKIAIDDFGTGYSNFEYLIKLNTDFIKIDGSLIKEIDTDEKLYGVVATIVEFAKKNNIKTIGEFVATQALYEKIKELNIDFAQGYYLGKPSRDIS